MTRQSHFAAIGQSKDDIKEFGVYNEDLQQLTQWFLDNQNWSYGKHRHLLAAFIYHFTGCGFQGYFMQWKVYQKYQGQKDRMFTNQEGFFQRLCRKEVQEKSSWFCRR